MKIHLTSLLLLGSLLCSCDKSGDPKLKSRTDILTSKKWRVTAITTAITTGGSTTTYDYYKDTEQCYKDNTYQFFAGKKLTYNYGAEKCDVNEPQEAAWEWEFTTADESKIKLGEIGGLISTFDVQEITPGKMILTYSNKYTNPATGGPSEQTNTFTYTAQ